LGSMTIDARHTVVGKSVSHFHDWLVLPSLQPTSPRLPNAAIVSTNSCT
jgi:hypothetical protein